MKRPRWKSWVYATWLIIACSSVVAASWFYPWAIAIPMLLGATELTRASILHFRNGRRVGYHLGWWEQ